MKPWFSIAVVLVVVAAGGLAVYFGLADEGADSSVGGGGADEVLGGSEEELEALGGMLKETEWLVVSDYDVAALKERLSAGGVRLTPDEEVQVLPVLVAHLKTLRANLEAAHEAAGQKTTRAERVRYVAAAAKAHGDLQRALRKIVSPETARALFNAVPRMLPPSPGRN